MKKMIVLAVVLGLLMSGCGGYLVTKNEKAWANMIEHSNADPAKFEIDHKACCDFTAMMINIPFADGLGYAPSTKYYEKCMIKKGYVSQRDYHIYKFYEHKQFEEWHEHDHKGNDLK